MKRLARVMLGCALIPAGGCHVADTPARTPIQSSALRIGLGSVGSAAEDFGLRQIVRNQSIEPLITYDERGRPGPSLAERWTLSPDRLALTVQLKAADFHDGSPLRAWDAVQTIKRVLPQSFGPLFSDVANIDTTGDRQITITFHRPTSFALDTLDVQVTKSDDPSVGTGPFLPGMRSSDGTELVANEGYHGGRPALNRIVLKPYPSVRAAWADLLRGEVDMLYEVGIDALDSLEPSSQVKLYTFRRHYQNVAIFNMRRAVLKAPGLRRLLNEAIDRDHLVADALGGLGRAATGPVWPEHWANAGRKDDFRYSPRHIAKSGEHLKLNCIFPNAMNERLALTLQRQLQSIGVDLQMESLTLDEFGRRLASSDYDLVLTEMIAGPGLIRPYLFWHSKGPYNYGDFNSREVDTALERIRDAENDEAYRRGVAAFQQAIADDPPAIFLAWSERARAVSSSFEVRSEPGHDILLDLYRWRPAGISPTANVN